MPEKPTKVQVPGQAGLLDAVEVGVSESTERWTEVHLEDGSIIKLKPAVISAARIENQYDQEGNPLYLLKATQVMIVASAPAHLRKGAPKDDPKTH